MFVSGAPDDRWDNDMLAFLREINAHDFEALDVFSSSSTPTQDRFVIRHVPRVGGAAMRGLMVRLALQP